MQRRGACHRLPRKALARIVEGLAGRLDCLRVWSTPCVIPHAITHVSGRSFHMYLCIEASARNRRPVKWRTDRAGPMKCIRLSLPASRVSSSHKKRSPVVGATYNCLSLRGSGRLHGCEFLYGARPRLRKRTDRQLRSILDIRISRSLVAGSEKRPADSRLLYGSGGGEWVNRVRKGENMASAIALPSI